MSLKEKVLKGSFYLTLRQLLAAVFSLVSTLVIARQLGPERYGIVSASVGIFHFLRWSSRIGLHTYVTRQPDLQENQVEQILAFYNLYGIFLCTFLWIGSSFFGYWLKSPEVTFALRLLIPFLWLDLIGTLSNSMLERDLHFDRVSLLDALAQVSNYTVSIPLVLLYKTYWAPVIGTAVLVCVSSSLAIFFRPIKFGWKWQWSVMQPILSYGLKFHLSVSLMHLKTLTVPLFVGRLLDLKAVGIVNIAMRMVQQLFLLRQVIRRMSISVMAKLMEDKQATLRALNNGMLYQGLVMGLACAGFSSLASWLIPFVFGPEYLPSARLVPLLGLAVLVGAIFDLHGALLHATDNSKPVSIANALHIVMLWTASWALLSTMGSTWGYAFAELIAVPSYLVTHYAVSKLYTSPNYEPIIWLVLASIPASIGGLYLEPWMAFSLFLMSYLLLLSLNKDVRKIITDLNVMLRTR